jgi:S-adenosylmethionine:tRNA ribosyltransferase-isomerase
MVFNDTRVIPARLMGVRIRGNLRAKVEVLLHRRIGSDGWEAFAKPARKLATGDVVSFGDKLQARVEGRNATGEARLRFDRSGPALDNAVMAHGALPLPPYIASKRATDARDRSDYQTVYAASDGAIAAPTAGLHFTPHLLDRIDAMGVERVFVTLHVGAGTFLPVKRDDIAQHRMHAEWGEVSTAAAAALAAARRRGARVVAVGTTSLRLLESASAADGAVAPWTGETDIFITPGYRFRTVDLLMTNFHLPKSTLMMLVSAFAGMDTMRRAYAHAVGAGYRFYSYGDSSLLHRAEVR